MTRLTVLAALLAVAVLLGRRTRREPTASAVLADRDWNWRRIVWHDDGDECTGEGCLNLAHDMDEPEDGIQPPDPGLTMRMGGAK